LYVIEFDAYTPDDILAIGIPFRLEVKSERLGQYGGGGGAVTVTVLLA
jgi:hypothetical protein